MNFLILQQSQITAEYSDLTFCSYFFLVYFTAHISFISFTYYRSSQEKKYFKVIYWNKQTWNIIETYFSSVCFDISVEDIEELISESIETIKDEKYKIPDEFSIYNYLNVSPDNDKYSIECRIRIWKYLIENT